MKNKYSKYKTSGIEWVGEIPNHWKMTKLKYLGETIIGLSYQPEDIVQDESQGILVLRSSNIQNGKLSLNDNVYVKTKIKDKIIVREGDILICSRNGSRSLIGKNITIDKRMVGNTFGVFMTVFRSEYWEFLSKIFNSPIFFNQSDLFLTSTINQLTVDTLNNFIIPFPTDEKERKQIVSYLDRRVTQIDDLIKKTENKIILLKEKRTSFINRVISKGINPKVQMKSSDVEWIDEIPKHWTIKKLKYVSNVRTSSVDKHIYKEERQVKVCNYTDVYYNERITSKVEFRNGSCSEEEYLKFQINKGDVIITKDSETPDDIGVPSFVSENLDNLVCGYHLSIITPSKDEINGEFLFRQIQTKRIRSYFEVNSNGITRYGLGKSSIMDTELIIPPIKEQLEIVNSIHVQVNEIDDLVFIEQRRIEIIKEYRKSLISEVVTGKIRVCQEDHSEKTQTKLLQIG